MILDSVIVSELKQHARDAAAQAYAPYSRFRVGAAVLTHDGRVFAGCNVENASYGLSICAERNAIFQAIARGARTLVAIVVYTATATPTSPCGACRQVMREFGADVTVICFNDDDGADRKFALNELLPMAFTLDSQ